MSPKAKAVLIVGALAAIPLALGLWWHQVRSYRATAVHLATLQHESQTLAAQLKREDQRIVAAERRAVATAGPTTVASTGTSPAAPAWSRAELIASDPALAVLELQRARGAVMREYQDFFQDERLSPAEIATFVQNSMRHSEHNLDLQGAALSQDASGKKTVANLRNEAYAEYQAAQLALLGPERMARMRTYDETKQSRESASGSLAGLAALTGIPLTVEQGRQLEQAAVAATRTEPTLYQRKIPVNTTTIDWDAFDARAREILTPEQFRLLTTMTPPNGVRTTRIARKFDEALDRALYQEVMAAQAGDKAEPAR